MKIRKSAILRRSCACPSGTGVRLVVLFLLFALLSPLSGRNAFAMLPSQLAPLAESASNAEPPSGESLPEGMVYRWVPPFYMAIPTDWKPMVERREGIGFFTGAHPEMLDAPDSDIPMAALMVVRMPLPGEGDYRSFFAEMERSASGEKTRNFVSHEEPAMIGERPAAFFSFSGEAEIGGTYRKMGGGLVVTTLPDFEGVYTLVVLAGTSSAIEGVRDVVKEILASAKEARPPLRPLVSFPYGSTPESFRHVYGPAVDADGTIAIGESLGSGRVRLFDRNGALMSEWGSRGKGEDGTFNYPKFMAFGPDGLLYVLDQGYSVDPHVQRFSKSGEFLGKMHVDEKRLGDSGIRNPELIAVTDAGSIAVAGFSPVGERVVRVLVLSPEGELLSKWEPGDIGGLVALPNERLLVTKPQPGNDRAPLFAILDLQGNTLKEWPFFGSALEQTPGDEKIYFSPKYIAADTEGRIYVYDESEYAIWMYDSEGRFLHAVPSRPGLGIVGGMTATSEGHLVIQDRPSGYGAAEPSLHVWENAFPAGTPSAPKAPAAPETPVVSPPDGEPALEAELARLKKALALREEAEGLEEEGNLAGAAAKYWESLPLHEDPAVEAYAAELELRAKIASMMDVPEVQEEPPVATPSPEPTIAVRSPLYDEAEKLELSGRRYEALLKYREGLDADFDEEMKEYADGLEKSLERDARRLVEQAVAVQKDGRLEDALALYRESLEVYPVERIREYSERLGALVESRRQGGDARERAERIWRRAAELQKAGEYDDALEKYREGLGIFRNSAVEEHVVKLEEFIRRRK